MSRKSEARWLKTGALGLLAVCLLAGCSLMPNEEAALKPPLVKPVKPNYTLYEAKRGNIVKELTGTAVFVAAQKQNLFFTEDGARLKSFAVNIGDRVKRGQVVAELETGDLEARYQLQELNLKKAQIMLEQQKQASEADAYAVRLKSIDVQIAQLQLDQLHGQLNRARLISPMDGVVTFIRDVGQGDPVSAYETLVTVSDPDKLNLVYEATASAALAGVELNMDVELQAGSTSLTGKVVQNPLSAPLSADAGTLERISKMIVIRPDGGSEHFKLGEQAAFTITLERKEDVIAIPRAGLRNIMGREYVQVLDGESVKEIDVDTGIVTSTEVEIRKGLQAGQMVILSDS